MTSEVLVSSSSSALESGAVVLSQAMPEPAELLPLQSMQALSPIGEWAQGLFPVLEGYSDLQIVGLGIALLVWILTVFWTLRDAMARSESVGYQLFSMLLVTLLSPVIGLPLYLAFRPLTYKWERGYWREALMQQVAFCPHCGHLVNPEHNACVACGEYLKTECKECHHRYYRGYAYCPECGAPNLD